MKKFSLCILLALATLTFSCKDEEGKMDPQQIAIMQGVDLYNFGQSYNTLTLVPAQIAIRLNTLMVQAKTLNGNTDVTVDIKSGAIDYKKKLFGNATFLIENGGQANETVVITYPIPYDYALANDNTYSGKIKIVTGGKLLSDFSTPTTWTLHNHDVSSLKMSQVYLVLDNYTLSATSMGVWHVNVGGLKSYTTSTEQAPAMWDASYDITLSTTARTNANFDNMTVEPIVISNATSSGNIQGANLKISYRTQGELTFQPKCSMNTVSSGTEIVTSNDFSQHDRENYPSPTVTVTWGWRNEGACQTQCTISYNGYQMAL